MKQNQAAAIARVALVLVFALRLALAAPVQAQPGRAQAGDRGQDFDITFPNTLLLQNGGPIINLKNPPPEIRAAKGDGQTDDTAAFQDVYDFLKQQFQKNGPWSRADYYVYLPNGTYKVSDTLIYRGPSLAGPTWNGTFDINHLRFVGQSRRQTIIRLVDNAPGYQDAAKPKIVLAFQHPDTVFNNVPGGNWLRNLTIDTGRGNPGAAALFFQGANNTDLRHVTIRSGDGGGKYGIWFKTGSIQGYYSDVTVDGFDYGIQQSVNAEGDTAFEYLTLRNQRVAGILHTGGGMSLRRLLSQQRVGIPALRIEGSGSQTVLLDSVLSEAKAAGPAIEMTANVEQGLFARSVVTPGYGQAIVKAGVTAVAAPVVDEYVSAPVKTLFLDTPLRSLRLPVEDTPFVPWFDPARDWAMVDDYPSVQAAFDAGKPVVIFKQRAYKLGGDVRVPAAVRSINVLGAKVEGGTFVVAQPSRQPLLVQDSGVPIRIEAMRDVIQRCASGGLSNPHGLAVTCFLENVNDNATGDDFCRPGQRVFARQIDIEYAHANQIVCNGGALWVFGYKTENGTSTPFTVKNGGYLEILGGYSNATAMPAPGQQNPLIRNDNSHVSATLFINLGGPWRKAIEETRNGVTAQAANTDFPKRGAVYAPDYAIPLYVGTH